MAARELKPRVLYLACTRPSLTWGMPTEAFSACVLFAGLVVVIFKNPIYFAAAGAASMMVCRQIVRHDHNAFRVWAAWSDTKLRCVTADFWRGSTADHLPGSRQIRTRRGIV